MRYRIPDDLAHVFADEYTPGDGRVYCMQVPNGRPIVLDETAATLWALAAEGRDILPAAAEHYGVGQDEIREAVVAFLATALAQGLLERVSEEEA